MARKRNTRRSNTRKRARSPSPSPSTLRGSPGPEREYKFFYSQGRQCPDNLGFIEVENAESGEDEATPTRPGMKRRRSSISHTSASPADQNRFIKRIKSSHQPRGWHGLSPLARSASGVMYQAMSATRDFVEPDATVFNLLRNSNNSVLDCIASSKGGVLNEKLKKVDRKGKGREPPTGMVLAHDDLRILVWLRKSIQKKLDEFDSEKAREEKERRITKEVEEEFEREIARQIEEKDKETEERRRSVTAVGSQEETEKIGAGGENICEESASASDETLVMTPEDKSGCY